MISMFRKVSSHLKLLYFHYKRMPEIFRGFNQPSFNGTSEKSKIIKGIDYLYILFYFKNYAQQLPSFLFR
jgi:hypothetical protein